jgi:hypothetical protein
MLTSSEDVLKADVDSSISKSREHGSLLACNVLWLSILITDGIDNLAEVARSTHEISSIARHVYSHAY